MAQTKKKKTVKKVTRRPSASQAKTFRRLVAAPRFAKLYAAAAVVVLLGTTIFWSLLSARVQSGNADQLVDPYLFAGGQHLRGAQFPSSHTFLLKWPLFLTIHVFGDTAAAYTAGNGLVWPW